MTNLQQSLETFDFRTESTIPAALLEKIKSVNFISCYGKDSLDAQELNTVFFAEPQSLRCYLINKLGYKDSERLITFYCYNFARKVYYDFKNGQRLGDEIGINNWFLNV
jgi:hypothetical protein